MYIWPKIQHTSWTEKKWNQTWSHSSKLMSVLECCTIIMISQICFINTSKMLPLFLYHMFLDVLFLQAMKKLLGLYLTRFSTIAGSMINCGPILSWLEVSHANLYGKAASQHPHPLLIILSTSPLHLPNLHSWSVEGPLWCCVYFINSW